MRRAIDHSAHGAWPEGEGSATVTLDFDARSRRRIRLQDDAGRPFLLDLPVATVLHDGDGLRLDDGTWIAVAAAREGLSRVTCRDLHHLVRVAWHLGNRHLPTEIEGTTIYIRRDHVIEAMLRGLGAEVRGVERAFNPEGGAYGGHGPAHGGHRHGDDHDDDHDDHGHGDHGHAHGHRHRHRLAPLAPGRPWVGPGTPKRKASR